MEDIQRHDGRPDEQDFLMTPAEVARLFNVHPKSVTRWARSGKLHARRTMGGHRRFWASEVYAWFHAGDGR